MLSREIAAKDRQLQSVKASLEQNRILQGNYINSLEENELLQQGLGDLSSNSKASTLDPHCHQLISQWRSKMKQSSSQNNVTSPQYLMLRVAV